MAMHMVHKLELGEGIGTYVYSILVRMYVCNSLCVNLAIDYMIGEKSEMNFMSTAAYDSIIGKK